MINHIFSCILLWSVIKWRGERWWSAGYSVPGMIRERELPMIQDIEPKKLSNTYVCREPQKESRILIFRDDQILYANREGQMEFLTWEQLQRFRSCRKQHQDEAPVKTVYLFSVEEVDYFLTDIGSATLPEGFGYHKMFETRTKHPKENVFAAATGWHLYVWYRDNQFCGRCGGKLVHDSKLRMMRCPACGNMVFPKIAPAVIVGVTDGDRILMTKYAGREYKKYALIAGFTEVGETAEQTVEREVMEEVGLNVRNIRYYKSQPWGYDSNLLMGYFCDLADNDEIHMDETELSVAEWVDYRDIPDDPEGLSLTREMMITFREQKKREYGQG